jgi:hypothetical protein
MFTVSQAVCAIIISTDIVARDGVAVADDVDPTPGVAGDDVPFAIRVAADGVGIRATVDLDTVSTVAWATYTVLIGANVVARNGIARRAAAIEVDAILAVARDDVPFAIRVAANGVVLSATIEVDPIRSLPTTEVPPAVRPI